MPTKMKVIVQVTLENFHELVPGYIHGNGITINNYEDMKELYLGMLRDHYIFTFDRDILITCLIDMTYMYAPGDDLNKDAVLEMLMLDDDDDDDDDDADDDVEYVGNEDNEGNEGNEGNEIVSELVSDFVNRSLDVSPTINDTPPDQCPSGM